MTREVEAVARPLQRGRKRVRTASESSDGVGLHVVNGRIVGPSIADPAVQREINKTMAPLRKDKAELLKFYVKQGLLTPTGKLKKSYGG